MADIQNNSTDIPLEAFQKFIGKSFKPSIDFITIAVALNTSTSGTLQVLHSFDDINYFTFGDEFSYTEGSHSRQVSIKGHYFKISFENGAVPQTSFNLYTRILKQINDDLNVTTKASDDTITVFPPETGFLSSEHDSITIPTLDACITGVNNNTLNVFVTNQSGGSASNVQIFDSNGDSLLSDGSGKLQVSGSFDVGLTNYALEDNGHLESVDMKLDIVQGLTFLNNKLVVDTGITGYATNAKLDQVISAVNNKHLNSTTDSVNIGNFPSTQPISGSVSVLNFPAIQPVSFNAGITVNNFPVNYSTETKQDITNEELEKIVNKTGDITAEIPYEQGASIWADSTPTPIENFNSPNGWLYQNSSAGNAMNLFYFNGNNETKTLSQVVGQYAVVTNLATVLNNKMILAIYTKGSPFFTTRITHSPPSNVNMVAGGKYLLYWGAVPEDIFPNLPRLNFSVVGTTGPAVGSEQILSVSLNSDSSATAGSVVILIESLGVVFSDGSVNQSRVYNLITDKTEYQLTSDIKDTLRNLNQKITTTDGSINSFIVNTTAIPVSLSGGLDINNFPATQNAFITNDAFTPVPVSFSGGIDVNNTVDVLITNVEPLSISGLVDINNFPSVQQVAFDGGITVNNFPTSINSRTQDAIGNNITSTDLLSGKRGLDTASSLFCSLVSDPNQKVAVTAKLDGKMLVSSSTNDFLGNGISSTTTSISGTATNSLDTASSLYVSNGTARTALTATGSSLNTNITNTVPVSGTFFQTTQPVSIASTVPVSGTFFQETQPVSIASTVPVSGTFFQNIQPISLRDGIDNLLTSTDTTATTRSLDTASALYTTDATTRSALTSTAISSIRALDVNVANSSVPVTFSNTTIGISGTASVSDTTSQEYLNNINNAIGDRPAVFALGNLINNGSLTATTFSNEVTFTKGTYRRNTLIIYRDSNTSNTGSISVYSSTTSGTPSNVLLGTFFPISNGTFRQFTGTFNLLPFANLFIRNDSDTTVTSVFVSHVNG